LPVLLGKVWRQQREQRGSPATELGWLRRSSKRRQRRDSWSRLMSGSSGTDAASPLPRMRRRAHTSPGEPFNDVTEGEMKIDDSEFGSITIAGRTYEHDVVIRLSEKVVKRKKKLSKRLYGTSHRVSEDEARFVFEKGCKELILGTGQYGNAALSPEAAAFLKKKGCKVIAKPTPKAIKIYNLTRKPKVGLFHVTC
jgi:hypothetical protein